MRFRLGLVFLGFASFFALVAVRLVQLQVLDNPDLRAIASRQYQRQASAALQRLPILDRNGEELAVNVRAASIFAHPRLVRNKDRTARALARVLGGAWESWKRRLSSKKAFIWIRRQVDEAKGKAIAEMQLPGIFVKPENARVYPNGPLAAATLGFTDIDRRGLAGVELSRNEELLQEKSASSVLRDGKGNATYIGRAPGLARETDEGVYLTLDRTLQYLVEEELRLTMERTQARAALAAVMDPFTGELLAIGQYPSFDPNAVSRYPRELFVNRFVSHLFEPGSTLKVILAAKAIEDGLLNPDSKIDCHNGKLLVERKMFREADSVHRFDVLSLTEVIRYSSNIGAVKIAQALGRDRVRAALDEFGLTRRTGIGLPGEVAQALRPISHWTPLVLATAGFGHGIAATPLQMLAAFAPFANGGYWIRPKVLRSEVEGVSKHNLDIRRVLSPETSRLMREILVSVTEHPKGTGLQARIPGIAVAGKTGTAQKYEAGKGYRSGKYVSSFIGFLPADHPQLLIGVFVDEPKGDYYASQIAAPLFQRIARKALHRLDRAPKQLLASAPRDAEPEPPLPALVQADGDRWVMPDLSGRTLRESIAVLGKRFDRVRSSGHGFLVRQEPKPGSPIWRRTPIQLEFSPHG